MANKRAQRCYTAAACDRSLPETLQAVLGAVPEEYSRRVSLAAALGKIAEKGLYLPPEVSAAHLWREAARCLNGHLPTPGTAPEPWHLATLLIFNGAPPKN